MASNHMDLIYIFTRIGPIVEEDIKLKLKKKDCPVSCDRKTNASLLLAST